MEIRFAGKCVAYDELKAADCFLFGTRESTQVGIKVVNVEGRPTPWVAALFPGHPETGRPVLWSGDAYTNDVLVHLPDAVFWPTRKLNETNFDRARNYRSGEVYQSNEQLVIAINVRSVDHCGFVDLQTGIFQPNPPSSPNVRFDGRKILVPGIKEHEYDVLCVFDKNS